MNPARAFAGTLHAARLFGPALALIAALAGCRAKGKDFENENDALRRRVVELENDLASARAESTEMRAKYEEYKRATADVQGQQIIDAIPRCAGVTIDRYSGLVDTDDDGRLDAIDIYIRPYDGRRRFVQVAGSLTVEASALGATGSGDAPRTLGAETFSAAQLREAYRSSPLGTHYTVRLPLGSDTIAPEGTIVIRAVLLDAVSGLEHRDERMVEPSAAPPR